MTQQVCMVIFLLGIGVSAHLQNSIFALIFILCHFNIILICTVFWIYMPEVLNDNQLGVSATTFYFNGVILSFITEYLTSLNSSELTEYLDFLPLFKWLGLCS